MGCRLQRSGCDDLYSQLFIDFTTQAFFRLLIRPDLAAWELPLVRHAHPCASLRGKHKAIALDYGAGDVDVFTINSVFIVSINHTKNYFFKTFFLCLSKFP